MYMYNKNCRAKKWWRRLFLHLLDLSIVNACILYNYQRDKRTCMPLLEFRMEVAKGLLINHRYRTDRRHPAPQADLPLRLTANAHFPQKIEKKTSSGGRPVCEVCRSRKIRSQTQFQCSTCKTPLHPYPCMAIYHTKADYSK